MSHHTVFSAGHCTLSVAFYTAERFLLLGTPLPALALAPSSQIALCLSSDVSRVTPGPCLLVTRTSTVGSRAHRPPSNSLLRDDTALSASCK